MPDLSIDVAPQHLLMQKWSPLGDLFESIQEQRTHGARIETFYCYFDSQGRLHMHFVERGTYLERKGALGEVPVGHLPGWLVHPAANKVGSKALEATEALVALPADVDPNDPRWDQIRSPLEAMAGS